MDDFKHSIIITPNIHASYTHVILFALQIMVWCYIQYDSEALTFRVLSTV